jgi:hypothetical protein
VVLSVLFASSVLHARAHAQEGDPTSASSPTEIARAEFERGVEHATRGEWSEARTRFEASLRAVPRVATAFNLVLALDRLGDHARLVEVASVFDSLARAARYDTQRRRVHELRLAAVRALRSNALDSESVSVTDTGSAVVAAVVTDAALVQDSESGSVTDSDAVTDSDSVAESDSAADSISVTDSDSVSVTDSDSVSVTGSDSVSVTDSDSVSVTGSDSVSVTDSDSVSVTDSDSVSVTGSDTISIRDTVSVADPTLEAPATSTHERIPLRRARFALASFGAAALVASLASSSVAIVASRDLDVADPQATGFVDDALRYRRLRAAASHAAWVGALPLAATLAFQHVRSPVARWLLRGLGAGLAIVGGALAISAPRRLGDTTLTGPRRAVGASLLGLGVPLLSFALGAS